MSQSARLANSYNSFFELNFSISTLVGFFLAVLVINLCKQRESFSQVNRQQEVTAGFCQFTKHNTRQQTKAEKIMA